MATIARSLGDARAVKDVVAYVGTLRAPIPSPATLDGDAAQGREGFVTCAACHGDAGNGSRVYQAPRLAGQHEWYLVKQLKDFRDGIRGAHADDQPGQKMRNAAKAELHDDKAIEDIVAYIRSQL